MKKKLLSLALALVMCLGLCVPAMAAENDYLTIENGVLIKCDYYDGPIDIVIPEGVTEIAQGAFYECDVTSVVIPGTVTVIGSDAFRWNKLTSVVIPEGVTTIGSHAFGEMDTLTTVTIPASVTEIGWQAFWCVNLKDIYYGGSEQQWNAINIDWEGEDGNPLYGNEVMKKATMHYNASQQPPAAETPAETPAEAPAEPPAEEAPAAPANPFADVAETSPFYNAILWAVDQGITNGTTPTTFGPGNTCTVRQILTFLCRANTGDPSTTLDAAVAWAVEQGMISADDDTTAPCTRAAAVTFMWKAAGSPEADASKLAFTDVAAGADSAAAVAWAVDKGVTAGTGDGTTFSPDNTCTRGQIVTFLYRAANAASASAEQAESGSSK